MDTVLLRILNSAHLKTHKYFRVSVPQAITGQVLVQHIHNAFYASSSPSSSNQPSSSVMTAEDVGEAVHFATMLLQYGYIFPVIDVHAQSVKVCLIFELFLDMKLAALSIRDVTSYPKPKTLSFLTRYPATNFLKIWPGTRTDFISHPVTALLSM